jgi:hypothetical protein
MNQAAHKLPKVRQYSHLIKGQPAQVRRTARPAVHPYAVSVGNPANSDCWVIGFK